MTALTKNQVRDIDKELDAAIEGEELLRWPRETALIHLLRYFEDFIRIGPPDMPSGLPPAAHQARWKSGQDGMQFAINWIFQYCQPAKGKPDLEFDARLYLLAQNLLKAAMSYSRAWDFMATIYGGRAVVERDKNGVIRLRYSGPLEDYVDITGFFFSNAADAKVLGRVSPSSLGFDPNTILKGLTVETNRAGRIKYHISNATLRQIAEYRFQDKSSMWELEDSWDLGGYTVAQFKELWTVIDALCWARQKICYSGGLKDNVRRRNIIRVQQRASWEAELASCSLLDPGVVSKILEDLIYDPTLYLPGMKQSDPTYQPFFPLSSALLAVSNQLVYLSNAERNLWDLLSIKRERLHSELRNKKEAAWLKELTPMLGSCGFNVYGPIEFNHEGKASDLDLLIIDAKEKIGMAWQLKWLTEPDRIKDYKYTDQELVKGLDQAELSLHWLRSYPKRLQQVTGLTAEQLSHYAFKAMVISRNTVGSGWLRRPGFPIVNNALVSWVLDDPHHKGLRELWLVGEERRYLPKRGKHFREVDTRAQFGGIRFVGEKMGMLPLAVWDPAADISMP